MDSLYGWDIARRFPGGDKDPFEDAYGPTSACFSSNDVVRMFKLGATLRDREHFTACTECRDRIGKQAEATHQPMPVSSRILFDQGGPIRIPARAVVFSPAICAVNQGGIVESIGAEILTGVSPELQRMKVTLQGPLIGSLTPSWDGNRFQLRNVKASKEVMETLRSHRRFMQPAYLQFGQTAGAPELIANCNFEFLRSFGAEAH